MRRDVIGWTLAAAGVFVGLPWLAVHIVQNDMGFLVCLLLFFGVNPLFMVLAGFMAGQDVRRRWWVPLAAAEWFLAGAWLVFDSGEMTFLWYAAGYLLLGWLTMGVRYIWKRVQG